MTVTKLDLRRRWAELRTLVAESDPLGLLAVGAPRDEYDCLLGPLMRLLQERASPEECSALLGREFSKHLGVDVPPDAGERMRFAERARAWFSERSRAARG